MKLYILHPMNHWEELIDQEDPLAVRARAGDVPQAGIVIAIPPLPPAPGESRFFALLHDLEKNDLVWKEVTSQVQPAGEGKKQRVVCP